MTSSKNVRSWGRYPQVAPARVVPVYWRHEVPNLASFGAPVLPYAYGRSYGDSCLNEGGVVLDVSHLRRLLAFDEREGLLRCEAGVSLAEILAVMVPRGWFLPVTPGTKYVSVGGAIASDIHGKNHHRAGTFGCHVTCFELLRSSGERLLCSPTENSELFRATIGGLGLTGVILWAEFRLKPIANPLIEMERIRFASLEEFLELSEQSDRDYEYTVSWVDCLIGGKDSCRGIFMRGNHAPATARTVKQRTRLPLSVPLDLPALALNAFTVKAFNALYYRSQVNRAVRKVVHYDPFFYPLDSIKDWNRLYGRRGFLQYQCVVPFEGGRESMRELLERIRRSGQGSFLTVLKTFGDVPSPGLLSFPRPGLTLALDFAYHGRETLQLLDELDAIVRQSGGAVYPAKDARMSAQSFQAYFPRWREFARYKDPQFSSSFWRRVTTENGEEEYEDVATGSDLSHRA
ncbi:MAG TPA: FAD-binding oxidoreductase [Ktedonobacteraceae bacterium]|nr:FAD-binding oxidoreductase [Ktedonobacteraceae bacterium]